MPNQLLIHEMVYAVQRERRMAGAAQDEMDTRSYRSDKSGLAASAQYLIGNALVRAGRLLQGTTAPRPEPAGR